LSPALAATDRAIAIEEEARRITNNKHVADVVERIDIRNPFPRILNNQWH